MLERIKALTQFFAGLGLPSPAKVLGGRFIFFPDPDEEWDETQSVGGIVTGFYTNGYPVGYDDDRKGVVTLYTEVGNPFLTVFDLTSAGTKASIEITDDQVRLIFSETVDNSQSPDGGSREFLGEEFMGKLEFL